MPEKACGLELYNVVKDPEERHDLLTVFDLIFELQNMIASVVVTLFVVEPT